MRILCTAKDSHIFSTKNNCVFVTLADICLTNLCLNDALNNWAQIIAFFSILQNSATAKDQKVLCCWCCASDPIIAKISINRQGYVPGEVIVVNAEIDNRSSREMTCSKLSLVMVRCLSAAGDWGGSLIHCTIPFAIS